MAAAPTSHDASLDEEAEERQAPSSQVVHEAIAREGREELERSNSALAWSGLAGGLAMGFSLITESALRAHLPDAPWRPLVAKLGYSVGFLIVILGRQQLFTENTLTPILPLLEQKSGKTLLSVLRLWTIVLLANLVGAFAIALAISRTDALAAEVRDAVTAIGRETLEPGPGLVLWRGVFAGWLIALLVWLLPAAETARVWVIVLITYVIGLGHFSHVIAGAIDVFAAAAAHAVSWNDAVFRFLLPALAGNIIGGVTLVACINHAQATSGGDK